MLKYSKMTVCVKSFKMMLVRSLYFDLLVRYSQMLKEFNLLSKPNRFSVRPSYLFSLSQTQFMLFSLDKSNSESYDEKVR